MYVTPDLSYDLEGEREKGEDNRLRLVAVLFASLTVIQDCWVIVVGMWLGGECYSAGVDEMIKRDMIKHEMTKHEMIKHDDQTWED